MVYELLDILALRLLKEKTRSKKKCIESGYYIILYNLTSYLSHRYSIYFKISYSDV
jgi:hypothetical protein